MTVENIQTRVNYGGDGDETTFPVPFPCLDDTDLVVILRDASGVEDLAVLDSDYTVAADLSSIEWIRGDPIVPPASGEALIIMRVLPLTQLIDYTEHDPFPAASHETGLDRAALIGQQLQEQLNRTPHIKKSSGTSDIEISDVAAGEYLRWNLAGDGIDSINQVSDLGTFLQSGTGAVPRTAAAKMGEILSITDFDGVIGDGATDCTTGLIAAITAAKGRTLICPKGIYLTGELPIVSNITFKGEGRYYSDNTKGTVFKLKNGADTSLITATATKYNVVFENIKFDGNKANQTDTTDVLVDLTNARRVVIDNCYFYNAIGDALKVRLAHITHCFFMTNDRRNVDLVTDNYFAFNEVAGGWHSGASWSDGSVWAGSGANKIIGNSIYLCAGSNGLALNSSVKNIVIGNRVHANYAHGIYAVSADYNIIKGNRCEDNSTYGVNSRSGICLTDADYNIVSENICMDDEGTQKQKYGIEETGTSDYNQFAHNEVHLNKTGGIAKVGAHTRIEGNIGADETLTAAAPALQTWGYTELDSTSNAVDGTLADGSYIGQTKTIVMTEASNSSTITIAHHQTEDDEVATFDAVDETGVFMWTGTEWITIFATCTFV